MAKATDAVDERGYSSTVRKVLVVDSSGIPGTINVTDTPFTERIAYNGSNLTEYLGKAVPGTATSAATWQIKKLIYSGNYVIEILFADGDGDFDNVWDNHASLSYS